MFVREPDQHLIDDIAQRFVDEPGIAEVLVGPQRDKYALDHPRAGEIVLISKPSSWQAYYWWFDDARAPAYARTVDIHRKPGYDPVELHFDPRTRRIPFDATLVGGSHGAPVTDNSQRGVLLSSHAEALPGSGARDVDVAGLVLRQFGVELGEGRRMRIAGDMPTRTPRMGAEAVTLRQFHAASVARAAVGEIYTYLGGGRNAVTAGLERTFRLLLDTANEAAVPVLLAALESLEPAHPGRCVSCDARATSWGQPAAIDRTLAPAERTLETPDCPASGPGDARGAVVASSARIRRSVPTVAMRCCTFASSISIPALVAGIEEVQQSACAAGGPDTVESVRAVAGGDHRTARQAAAAGSANGSVTSVLPSMERAVERFRATAVAMRSRRSWCWPTARTRCSNRCWPSRGTRRIWS